MKHLLPFAFAFFLLGSSWAEEGPTDWNEQRNKHWAWNELTDPKPPQVKKAKWVRNEIDRFILAKLEEKGLSPNGEAGASVLNRRLHFGLVGLPGVVDAKNKSYEDVMEELKMRLRPAPQERLAHMVDINEERTAAILRKWVNAEAAAA